MLPYCIFLSYLTVKLQIVIMPVDLSLSKYHNININDGTGLHKDEWSFEETATACELV